MPDTADIASLVAGLVALGLGIWGGYLLDWFLNVEEML